MSQQSNCKSKRSHFTLESEEDESKLNKLSTTYFIDNGDITIGCNEQFDDGGMISTYGQMQSGVLVLKHTHKGQPKSLLKICK